MGVNVGNPSLWWMAFAENLIRERGKCDRKSSKEYG
jgi:hypothetical protein